jgi:predicted GNAT family acetyltransferase
MNMKKTNQTATQSNTNTSEAIGGNPVSGTSDVSTTVVQLAVKGHGNRQSLFENASEEMSKAVAHKVTLFQSIRQHLALAKDLYDKGSEQAGEAEGIAAKAATELYQVRTSGGASNEEISALLGDIFGYKPKKDQTPGKTPAGAGETLRKRLVKAAQAHDYCNDPEGSGVKAFAGIDPKNDTDDDGNSLQSVCDALSAGTTTVWTAYPVFSAIVRAHRVKTDRAFDPKHILMLVESLSETGAADIVRNSQALITAYAALTQVLAVIGEMPVEDSVAA